MSSVSPPAKKSCAASPELLLSGNMATVGSGTAGAWAIAEEPLPHIASAVPSARQDRHRGSPITIRSICPAPQKASFRHCHRPDPLDPRRAFELIDRRQAGIGIDERLPRLMIVVALDRDLRAVRHLAAALLHEGTE